MAGQTKTQQKHQDPDTDASAAGVRQEEAFSDLEDPLAEAMVDPMLMEAETDTAERGPPSEEALGLFGGLWAAMEAAGEAVEEPEGDGAASEAVDTGIAAASAASPSGDAPSAPDDAAPDALTGGDATALVAPEVAPEVPEAAVAEPVPEIIAPAERATVEPPPEVVEVASEPAVVAPEVAISEDGVVLTEPEPAKVAEPMALEAAEIVVPEFAPESETTEPVIIEPAVPEVIAEAEVAAPEAVISEPEVVHEVAPLEIETVSETGVAPEPEITAPEVIEPAISEADATPAERATVEPPPEVADAVSEPEIAPETAISEDGVVLTEPEPVQVAEPTASEAAEITAPEVASEPAPEVAPLEIETVSETEVALEIIEPGAPEAVAEIEVVAPEAAVAEPVPEAKGVQEAGDPEPGVISEPEVVVAPEVVIAEPDPETVTPEVVAEPAEVAIEVAPEPQIVAPEVTAAPEAAPVREAVETAPEVVAPEVVSEPEAATEVEAPSDSAVVDAVVADTAFVDAAVVDAAVSEDGAEASIAGSEAVSPGIAAASDSPPDGNRDESREGRRHEAALDAEALSGDAADAAVVEDDVEESEGAGAVAILPGIAAASDTPPERGAVAAPSALAVARAAEPVHGLKRGAAGELVLRLQEVLNRAGHDPGLLDGRYDQETESAVIDYQIENDLDPTGVVDTLTDEALVPGGGLVTLLVGGEEAEEDEQGLVSSTAENADDDDDDGGVQRRRSDEDFDALGAPEERAGDWRIFDAAMHADRIADLTAQALQSVGAAALVQSLAQTGGHSVGLKIGDDLAWHPRTDRSAALEDFARQQSDDAALIDDLPQTQWKTGDPAEDARISGVVMVQGAPWMVEQAAAGAQWMGEAVASTRPDASAALSILGSATGGLW